jgi:hypothetical protein
MQMEASSYTGPLWLKHELNSSELHIGESKMMFYLKYDELLFFSGSGVFLPFCPFLQFIKLFKKKY